MDLIQLKMPPDKATLLADAVQRDLESRPEDHLSPDLRDILVWLRYRVQRWQNNHPADPAA